jgi:hypothetical protein
MQTNAAAAQTDVAAYGAGLRQEIVDLWGQLDTEYTSGRWLGTHRDIIDFIQPNRGAFWPSETNKGDTNDAQVLNNTAQDGARKLAAAMDTGITSEAREWFTVAVDDPVLADDHAVREYCHAYQRALYALISRIGFYAPNRNVLEDLVGPAIGLMLIEEDRKTVARCTHVPVGQYRVAANSSGEVNTVGRRFLYTATQMVEEFGEERCSQAVRTAIANRFGQTTKFTVLHIIRERVVRQPGKIDARNKPWESVWMELGSGYSTAAVGGASPDATGARGVLRVSGYDECPFYCPRWDQIGQNAYGTNSPGWVVLRDTQSLQDLELGGATTLAKIMDPALNVPATLSDASILPGARNQLPDNAKVKIEPTVTIPPEAVKVFEMVVNRYEYRINRGLYGDILFLLSSDQHAQPKTAEEIRGKKEERLLQLGGVFNRVARELRKAIARIAAIGQRAGLLPLPPQQLLQRGLKLRLEFNNPLITAQRAIGVSAISQTISIGLAAAQAKAGGFDNLDTRKTSNLIADMLGAPPDMLLSEEEMARATRRLRPRPTRRSRPKRFLPPLARSTTSRTPTPSASGRCSPGCLRRRKPPRRRPGSDPFLRTGARHDLPPRPLHSRCPRRHCWRRVRLPAADQVRARPARHPHRRHRRGPWCERCGRRRRRHGKHAHQRLPPRRAQPRHEQVHDRLRRPRHPGHRLHVKHRDDRQRLLGRRHQRVADHRHGPRGDAVGDHHRLHRRLREADRVEHHGRR